MPDIPPEIHQIAEGMGAPIPRTPTDHVRQEAQVWRDALTVAAPAGSEAVTTTRQIGQTYRGDAGTAMADRWKEMEGDQGHLQQAFKAAAAAADTLDNTAWLGDAVKFAAATTVAAAAVYAAYALLTPGGTIEAAAIRARARALVTRVVKQGGEAVEKIVAPALERNAKGPLGEVAARLRPLTAGPEPAYAGPTTSATLRAEPAVSQESNGIAFMGRREKAQAAAQFHDGQAAFWDGQADQLKGVIARKLERDPHADLSDDLRNLDQLEEIAREQEGVAANRRMEAEVYGDED